jgi:cytochrome c
MKFRLAMTVMAATALAVGALTQAARAEGDPAKGADVFKKCMPCHRIGPGATNLVGPELNGLDGRHTGSAPGYNYSPANKKSGIVWTKAEFEKYIQAPQKVIPGTKMFFAGIHNKTDIENLWAYLAQFKADGSKKK